LEKKRKKKSGFAPNQGSYHSMKSSVRAKVKRSITQLFHSLTTIQSVHRMKEEASKQNPSNWVCRDYVLLHICQWTESCV